MRQLLTVSVLTLVAAIGCAHGSKKVEAQAPAPAPAPAKADVKAAPTAEAAKATAASDKVECEHKADKRVLEVRAKDKGCELAYSKNGQEAIVSTSKSGKAHCEGSLNKIKEKLTGAGFTCK